MRSRERRLRTLWANPLVIGLLAVVIAIGAIALAPLAVLVVRYKIQMEFLTRPLALGMLVLPFAYGCLRGLLFHPVFDRRYSEWLANTPWTPKHPLPKGPVQLVWTDAVVVGVLTAAMYLLSLMITPPIWPFVVSPVVLFTLAIAFVWSMANWATGQRIFAYAVVCVPLLFGVLRIPSIGFLLCCPFVVAGIAWLGVRRSLATFPWIDPEAIRARELRRSMSIIGWPYRQLLCSADEILTTPSRALTEAALVAGWLWFLTSGIPESHPTKEQPPLTFFIGIASLFAAGTRLLGYAPVICENLCWGRRIANRQWILWRHDQILFVPLVLIFVGLALPWVLHHVIGVTISMRFAMTAGLLVFIFRGLGPSVEELQYTGVHSKFGRLGPSKEFITARGSNS